MAKAVRLSSVPPVLAVHHVSMPLVFGVFRPAVLVPSDFESWAREEQRATLLHEFIHIQRHDGLGQMLSILMRVLYWFHPAAGYLDRLLQETREWATDQQVIETGMTRNAYANNLLNIVERTSIGRKCTAPYNTAIAMSANSKIEERLSRILSETSEKTLWMRLVGPCAVTLLFIVTATAVVRVELATAQDPPASTIKPSVTSNSSVTSNTASSSQTVTNTLISNDEGDLYSRFRDSEVLAVTGADYDAIFNVSGQVVTAEGEPVAAAIVLLRESSSNRAQAERSTILDVDNPLLGRTKDVLAKTVTDAEGKFVIRDAKSPAMPKTSSLRWDANIVVAHGDHGFGQVKLTKDAQGRVNNELKVTLRPTNTISGRFVSADNSPIAKAMVAVTRLSNLGSRPIEWSDDVDLYLSQICPRTSTDSNGRFTITGIPQGFVAWLLFNHSDWINTYAMIATSDEVPTGEQRLLTGNEIVYSSPAEIVSDTGFVVPGQVVDSDGKPVANVRVGCSIGYRTYRSLDDGTFHIQVQRKQVQRAKERFLTEGTVYAWPDNESGYLSTTFGVSIDDIEAAKPIEIQLTRGVLVTGKVVSTDGSPLEAAQIR